MWNKKTKIEGLCDFNDWEVPDEERLIWVRMTTHQTGDPGLRAALTEPGQDVAPSPVLAQTDTLVGLTMLGTGELRPG